jgi:isopenicillin-N epimerase
MHWCWERAAIRQGLTLKMFALPTMARTPAEIVEAAAAAMTSKTRLFFFSHVLSPTGLVLPARELCAEARKRGILTVVDGAHAPAMLPLDIDAIGADFYTGNCHKWLLAPTGSGFLVLGPGNEDRLQPLHVSWGYHFERGQIDQRDEFGSTPRLRHLEFEGTRDTCPWLAVPEAIAFQTELGWERIRGRIAELTEHSRQQMAGKVGLPSATPAQPGMHGAMTAFELPIDGPERAVALRQAIWKHRIEVPIIERPERLLIRLSTHFYNTEDEIDRLAQVLPDALQASG